MLIITILFLIQILISGFILTTSYRLKLLESNVILLLLLKFIVLSLSFILYLLGFLNIPFLISYLITSELVLFIYFHSHFNKNNLEIVRGSCYYNNFQYKGFFKSKKFKYSILFIILVIAFWAPYKYFGEVNVLVSVLIIITLFIIYSFRKLTLFLIFLGVVFWASYKYFEDVNISVLIDLAIIAVIVLYNFIKSWRKSTLLGKSIFSLIVSFLYVNDFWYVKTSTYMNFLFQEIFGILSIIVKQFFVILGIFSNIDWSSESPLELVPFPKLIPNRGHNELIKWMLYGVLNHFKYAYYKTTTLVLRSIQHFIIRIGHILEDLNYSLGEAVYKYQEALKEDYVGTVLGTLVIAAFFLFLLWVVKWGNDEQKKWEAIEKQREKFRENQRERLRGHCYYNNFQYEGGFNVLKNSVEVRGASLELLIYCIVSVEVLTILIFLMDMSGKVILFIVSMIGSRLVYFKVLSKYGNSN